VQTSPRAAIVLVVLLAVAGCAGTGDTGDAAVRYLEQPAVSCPASGGTVTTAPQPLAADFVPVTASMCTFRLVIQVGASGTPATPSNARGGWQWQTVQRSSGPFTQLLQALRSPGPISSPSTICPSIAAAPFLLILADAAGHTAVPAIPATPCNRPHPDVQKALDALPWTTTATR
jgi:hypothetical protein